MNYNEIKSASYWTEKALAQKNDDTLMHILEGIFYTLGLACLAYIAYIL